MSKSKYFFCYSSNVHKFLNKVKNIDYVCAAKHETTDKKFWLYEQSDFLTMALNEYKRFFKGGDVN